MINFGQIVPFLPKVIAIVRNYLRPINYVKVPSGHPGGFLEFRRNNRVASTGAIVQKISIGSDKSVEIVWPNGKKVTYSTFLEKR